MGRHLKNIKRIFIIVFSILLVLSGTAYADENEVKKDTVYFLNDRGQMNQSIFSEKDMLFPGEKIEREFYIANTNSFKCELKTLDITNGELRDRKNNVLGNTDDRYKEFMRTVKIHFYTEDRELFKGSAEDFFKANFLDNKPIEINSNDKKKFIMEIEMDMSSDKKTMDLEYIFTLVSNLCGDEGKIGNLVQTGGRIDTTVLLISGITLIIIGIALYCSRKIGLFCKGKKL